MREDQYNKLLTALGKRDAERMVQLFDRLKIGSVDVRGNSIISISPVSLAGDFNVDQFRQDLKKLSLVGRAFNLTIGSDGSLSIDTLSMKLSASADQDYRVGTILYDPDILELAQEKWTPTPSPHTGRRKTSSNDHVEVDRKFFWQNDPFYSSVIKSDMKVLNVGVNAGVNAEKMKAKYKCDVYALQADADIELPSDFKASQDKLGIDRVINVDLGDAVRVYPEKFTDAFDVVNIVYRHNVADEKRDDFVNALVKAVKSDAQVHITLLPKSQLNLTSPVVDMQLISALKDKFNMVESKGGGTIHCSGAIKPNMLLSR